MGERILIESLEPVTRTACIEHQRRCALLGLHTLVTSGARSWNEQMTEWAKGREYDPLAGWHITDARKVVTHALPDMAPHCRAAAYDLWLLFGKPGQGHLRLATMDPRDGWTPAEIEQQTTLWGAVVRIGSEVGMEAGAHWAKIKDFPHFQRPDWRSLPPPADPGGVA